MMVREVLKTRSWPPKLVPVVFVFLLVNYLRKHLGFRDLSHFWGVCNFLHFESFLMGISMGQFPDIEFAYYTFKSGKWIKQTPTPPFWGDVGVKKWSQILDSGTRSPIFGHLKMGTFAKRAFSTKWWPGEENAPKIIFFAFLVSFHINTTYIKLDWNSDNFFTFWCTLISINWHNVDQTGDFNVQQGLRRKWKGTWWE